MYFKKQSVSILFFLLIVGISHGQDFTTFYEKSNYKETPRYEATMQFCHQLCNYSAMAHMEIIGKSPQNRNINQIIIDKDGLTNPVAIRKQGRIIMMIQACIHAGEPDGKDAMLLFLRDMLVKNQNTNLLNKVSIVFIPILSVDGHERFGAFNRINQNGPTEMGWRVTAQNLNLNRDYTKAEAPEMQALLHQYNKWLPEFYIDTHTTDGADYQYALTYDINSNGHMDNELKNWLQNDYEPIIKQKMAKKDVEIFPYVQFRNWHDPRSGLYTKAASPILSHGYTYLHNRPALLIETHMLKNYKIRVEATKKMIVSTLEILNKNASQLQKIVSNADEKARKGKINKEKYPISFTTNMNDSSITVFKGFEYEVKKSDLTNGGWFIYDNQKPVDFTLPFFNKVQPADYANIPEAYIVPAEWKEIIKKLKIHGVEMKILKKSTKVRASTYQFTNLQFARQPFEGRQRVTSDYKTIGREIELNAGSAIVLTNQAAIRMIITLLEPKADGSLFNWGYFNAILEQKEYGESYVLETMAREMMKQNPELQKAFEDKKTNDKQFASNPMAMLYWFYRQSPYWDKNYMIYPIGKIFDKTVIDEFLKADK